MTLDLDPNLKRLKNRLAAWEDEKETNKHGMAHLAYRAIALLQDEISRWAPKRRDA